MKKLGHYTNQCRLLKKQREQTEDTQKNPGNKNSGDNNPNPNSNVNNSRRHRRPQGQNQVPQRAQQNDSNEVAQAAAQKTHMPEFRQRNYVVSQTSPMKETSPQVSGSRTELFLGNQSGSTPVQSLNDSKKRLYEIQRHEMNMTANDNGYKNISPPKITTSQTEEQLLRDDFTKELYMPLSSTILLKRIKQMLYVPLSFENGLTIDSLVNSGAYISAITQSELDRIKKQAPSNIFKFNDRPNFQIQVANGQLEKPISTVTLKFDFGDNIFAEHFS